MRKPPSARALAGTFFVVMLAAGCGGPRELDDREIEKIADRVYERLYPKVNQLIREQMAYRSNLPASTPQPTSALPVGPGSSPATTPDTSPVLVEIEGGRRFTLDDAQAFLLASARPGENLRTAFGRIVQVLLFAHAGGREKLHEDPDIRREIEVRTKDALTHYLLLHRDRQRPALSVEDVKTFYERSKNTFFTRPGTLKVRQYQARSLADAQAFIEKVRAGGSFEDLAAAATPVMKGSVLGKPIDLVPGQVPAKLFRTLEALEEGKMTAPLPIGHTGAFCVYQILEKKKAVTLPYASVRPQIQRMLLSRRRKTLEEELDAEARRRFKIVTFEDRLSSTDSLSVLATVEGEPVLRNDLLLELKRLPEQQRLHFKGADGFKRLFERYLRRELFARLALALPETAHLRKVGTEMRDLVLASHYTRKALGNRVRIPAKEVADYYNANRHLYRIRGADVCARLRQVRLDAAGDDARAKALDAAAKILEQVRQGASLGDLAAKISQDKTSASRGGDTGFVRVSKLPPEIRLALRALEPGQVVTRPVATKDAVFVIQLLAYSPYQPLEEVLEPVKRALALKKQEETIAEVAGKLGMQYRVKSYPDRIPPAPAPRRPNDPATRRPAPPKDAAGAAGASKGLRIIPIKRPKQGSKPPVIQWKTIEVPGAASAGGKGK